jgi:hypothetical protein
MALSIKQRLSASPQFLMPLHKQFNTPEVT